MESFETGLSSGGASGIVVYQPGFTEEDWEDILQGIEPTIKLRDILRYLGYVNAGGGTITRVKEILEANSIPVIDRATPMGARAFYVYKRTEKDVWMAMKNSGFLENTPWWREKYASTQAQAVGPVETPDGAEGGV